MRSRDFPTGELLRVNLNVYNNGCLRNQSYCRRSFCIDEILSIWFLGHKIAENKNMKTLFWEKKFQTFFFGQNVSVLIDAMKNMHSIMTSLKFCVCICGNKKKMRSLWMTCTYDLLPYMQSLMTFIILFNFFEMVGQYFKLVTNTSE